MGSKIEPSSVFKVEVREDNQPWDLELKPLCSHANLSSVYLIRLLKNQSLVSEFPDRLTDLPLPGSVLTEDPMQKLDKLPNLKVLRLFGQVLCRSTASSHRFRDQVLYEVKDAPYRIETKAFLGIEVNKHA